MRSAFLPASPPPRREVERTSIRLLLPYSDRMKRMPLLRVGTVLIVSPFADGSFWHTRAPLVWVSRVSGRSVTVPSGFVTDFASIPAIVWPLLPKWGKYGLASVVHDYLYAVGRGERSDADAALLDAMQDLRERSWRDSLIEGALRLAGGGAWRNNARRRSAGEIRIIADFPSDPRITWEAFRQSLIARDAHDGLVVGGLR